MYVSPSVSTISPLINTTGSQKIGFNEETAKNTMVRANELYNPKLNIKDLVTDWNFNFDDEKRLGIGSNYQWKGEHIVASLTLNKDSLATWSRQKKQIEKKEDIIEIIMEILEEHGYNEEG